MAISTDVNYLLPARQVVSNLHFNATWQGDILLLAHALTDDDVAWFRQRGVLIKHVDHLFENSHLPAATFGRYFLFTEEFRNWQTVIFLDVDLIVRSSIDGLCGLPGIHAVLGYKKTIRENFVRDKDPALFDEMDSLYDLELPAFNGGVLSWSTDIVGPDTFRELCQLTQRYLPISRFANQGLLNLFFRGVWSALPPTYNVYGPDKIADEDLLRDAIIVHFNGKGRKPWIPGSEYHDKFYREWRTNFERADDIPLPPRVRATGREPIF